MMQKRPKQNNRKRLSVTINTYDEAVNLSAILQVLAMETESLGIVQGKGRIDVYHNGKTKFVNLDGKNG